MYLYVQLHFWQSASQVTKHRTKRDGYAVMLERTFTLFLRRERERERERNREMP